MAASIHTHNFRQCSHTSVGLAQARPNYLIMNHSWAGVKLVSSPVYKATSALSMKSQWVHT